MGTERESTEIIMSIQKAAMLMDPFFKIGAMGAIYLMTYLARLAKEGKIRKSEFNSIQEFIQSTNGKYTIENIPIEKEYSPWVMKKREVTDQYYLENRYTGEIFCKKSGERMYWKSGKKAEKQKNILNNKEDLMLNDLKSMDVRHVILPDLDKNDGFVQVAVHSQDKEKFRGWEERYLFSKMQGGEKDLRDLNNLTAGNTSIVSIPVEGEDLIKLKQDFGNMRINYAILPDLNVGDGETQFVIANKDLGNVELWFGMFNQDLINRGEEPVTMVKGSMEGYLSSGRMTEEAYGDTASPELKDAIRKYEDNPREDIRNVIEQREKGIKSESDEKYAQFENDQNFVKISVDNKTCVEQSHLSVKGKELAENNGLFFSRIPGTWNSGEAAPELTLIVPKDQVFSSADQKTYHLFLNKNQKPLVLGQDGKLIDHTKRMSTEELIKKHYDPVERSLKGKTILQDAKIQKKGKTIEKIPIKGIKK